MDSNISRNLSIYLNNVFNFKYINDSLSNSFNQVFDEIIQGQRLSINFRKTFDDYPRYPYYYKYIEKMGIYNLLKIKQVTLDSVDKLIDSIDSDTISLKSVLDDYPIMKNDLIYDINLQLTYFTDQENLYNFLKFFLNFYGQEEYDNICYYLMGPSFHDNNDACEFSQQAVVMYYLSRLIIRITDFGTQFSDFMTNEDIFEESKVVTSFNSFIDSQQDDISSHLCQIVCRNVYNMINISDVIINLVKNAILEDIDVLKTKFESFLDIRGGTLTSDIDRNVRNSIYHVIILNLLKEIADPAQGVLNNIYSSDFSDTNGREEETIISEYLDKVTEHNIKSFLFLSYLYKFWPIKFLNVMSVILKNFTERKIVLSSDSYLSDTTVKSYIQYFETNGIDFATLSTFLTSELTSSNILDWTNEYEVPKFATSMRFIKLFDDFLDSTGFEDFLTTTLTGIQDVLIANGYIQPSLNYYTGFYLLKLYFKTLFRSKLYTDELFDDLITDLSDSLEYVFTDSYPSPISGEVPSGTTNGSNVLFTTKYQFDDATLAVYIDGVPSVDFTSNSKYHYVIFNTPPSAGTVITVDYTIYYELTYDYDESTLTSEFAKYIDNNASITEVGLFHRNMYLGSVTKQIYYNILNYFQLQ